MMKVYVKSTGGIMFRSTHKILTLILMAATSLLGVVPAIGTCHMAGREGGSKSCCEKRNQVKFTCCSPFTQVHTCQCSVDPERPTPPHERPPTDERLNALRVEAVESDLVVGDNKLRSPSLEDASLHSSLPHSRWQAILGHWLI